MTEARLRDVSTADLEIHREGPTLLLSVSPRLEDKQAIEMQRMVLILTAWRQKTRYIPSSEGRVTECQFM